MLQYHNNGVPSIVLAVDLKASASGGLKLLMVGVGEPTSMLGIGGD